MGRRGKKESSEKLDLVLNLSPPSSQGYYDEEGIAVAGSSDITASSCSSSSTTQLMAEAGPEHLDSNKVQGMVLVGCQRCLMYFMLSELDLKCPKCQSNSLLYFNNQNR